VAAGGGEHQPHHDREPEEEHGDLGGEAYAGDQPEQEPQSGIVPLDDEDQDV
jgi:hypothetical protein